MKYSESSVNALYDKNLKAAVSALSSIPVAKGRPPSVQGLNGWVYEQTIRTCLEEELALLGNSRLEIIEQFPIAGRAKADLKVGRTAIEIKAGGSFGDDSDKYMRYRKILNAQKFAYLYVTQQETYEPYRRNTLKVFGKGSVFFLSDNGSWRKFVNAVRSTNDQR